MYVPRELNVSAGGRPEQYELLTPPAVRLDILEQLDGHTVLGLDQLLLPAHLLLQAAPALQPEPRKPAGARRTLGQQR
jgi:hypothetical protein